ncbi:hypothetical protein DPMN_097858 [Dreissena polymorpha]|uniref:PGAP2IP second transmembrane domain-containing protein n=1 Tax=Dreissena polymorpha TaxID=45954 RepID=A0A9D4LB90_DREPO|nr:hypothetical protein DPMN_115289 [Dreissena polymorpha]KAH3855293.1 hypothetical protein DPMN_097858 [Dreissena polymorpha]
MSFGAYMSACRHVATSKVWWVLGLMSFLALYYLPAWSGFAGGLKSITAKLCTLLVP